VNVARPHTVGGYVLTKPIEGSEPQLSIGSSSSPTIGGLGRSLVQAGNRTSNADWLSSDLVVIRLVGAPRAEVIAKIRRCRQVSRRGSLWAGEYGAVGQFGRREVIAISVRSSDPQGESGVTPPHFKFGAPVPDQTKLGVTLPPDSGTPRPNYVFAGNHPPNYEGTNDGRILSFADPWLLPQS
jgi:hypothetical protein